MIIKFDHISYSCQLNDSVDGIVEGYEQDFIEKNLPNIEAKSSFLQEKSINHDISLYHCPEKYPIEITAYPVCNGYNRKYSVSDEVITIYSTCPEKTLEFYEALGFKRMEGTRLELLPFMEKKKVVLQVEPADTGTVFLDKGGFGSLAFVVDRIEKHKTQLEKKNYFVTGIDLLSVNGKELKICFAADKVGDIIELIGIR